MYDWIPLTMVRARLAALVLCIAACEWFVVYGQPAVAATENGTGQLVETGQLDVGLPIFDPGIPANASTHSKLGIFPEIRKAEAKYMPVLLRQVLVDSGDWGVVRVLPDALESSELLVSGTILHSDGQRLELQIKALDATGAQWLDKVYSGTATSADYPVKVPGDPFLDVYMQIAGDLLAVRRQKSAKQLADIRQVAQLRYASGLAPEAFASYLTLAPTG